MNKTHKSSEKANQSQHKRDDKKKSFNPFEGRDKEEVWKEISKNGTSMTQPEMIKQLKVIAEKGRNKHSSQ